MNRHETMWSLYEEYSTQLEEMSKQDWITFRSHTHQFEDFLLSWTDKLRSVEPSPITVKVQNELDKYQVLMSIRNIF